MYTLKLLAAYTGETGRVMNTPPLSSSCPAGAARLLPITADRSFASCHEGRSTIVRKPDATATSALFVLSLSATDTEALPAADAENQSDGSWSREQYATYCWPLLCVKAVLHADGPTEDSPNVICNVTAAG